MSAVVASGTVGPVVIGTETNLEAARAPSIPTNYVYKIDCGAIATDEVVFIRVYTVVLASGTERLEYSCSYIGGVDEDPIQVSVPIVLDTGSGITIRASVQQKNGTGRSFPWKLFAL